MEGELEIFCNSAPNTCIASPIFSTPTRRLIYYILWTSQSPKVHSSRLGSLLVSYILWAWKCVHLCTDKYPSLWFEFMCAKWLQSCLTVCDSMDCSPPGSSAHGILQARILEWVTMPSSRGSSWAGMETASLMSPALISRFFTTESPGKPSLWYSTPLNILLP